jgi:hypothetical protein
MVETSSPRRTAKLLRLSASEMTTRPTRLSIIGTEFQEERLAAKLGIESVRAETPLLAETGARASSDGTRRSVA